MLFVAPLLIEFHNRNPEIDCELDISPRRIDLQAELFDLALRIEALEDSFSDAGWFALPRVALYAAPSGIRALGMPKRPANIPHHRTVTVLTDAEAAHRWPSNRTEPRPVPLERAYTANSVGVIRFLVLRGASIALLDEALAIEDVAQ